MTVRDWLWIDETYERRRWGLREVVEVEVRRLASPAPSQIGVLFGIVGEKGLWRRVDKRRGAVVGSSEKALDRIYERRNKIAHQGERLGHGRATISTEEVVADLACIASIVDALDEETNRIYRYVLQRRRRGEIGRRRQLAMRESAADVGRSDSSPTRTRRH